MMDKQTEIAKVVDELILRNESPDTQELKKNYPHLFPELGDTVERLKRIQIAFSSRSHLSYPATSSKIPPLTESRSFWETLVDSDRKDLVEQINHKRSDGTWNLGKYSILRQLGEGGFGTVWLAFDNQLERCVALKLPISERYCSSNKKLFLSEARVVATMSHRGIAKIFEFGKVGDQIFIASEYISGNTLAAELKTRRFSFQESAECCLTIAKALWHAHQCGIIHRDIKPANIILNNEMRPVLTDFGLAKSLDVEETRRPGKLVGTPAFMSPEQAKGQSQDTDARSDIYSLGVVLYQMCAGRLPFKTGGDLDTLLDQIIHQTPPALRQFRKSIPLDLQAICLKCLEKDPSNRYQTTRELEADLQCFLQCRETKVRRWTAAEKLGRTVRTHALLLSLASLSLVIATTSITSSIKVALKSRERTSRLEMADRHIQRKLFHFMNKKSGINDSTIGKNNAAIRKANRQFSSGDLGLCKQLLNNIDDLAHASDTDFLELATNSSNRNIVTSHLFNPNKLTKRVRFQNQKMAAMGIAYHHLTTEIFATTTLQTHLTIPEACVFVEVIDSQWQGSCLVPKRVVSQTSRGRIELWDVEHRQSTLIATHDSPVRTAFTIPSATSERLVLVTEKQIQILSLHSGRYSVTQTIQLPELQIAKATWILQNVPLGNSEPSAFLITVDNDERVDFWKLSNVLEHQQTLCPPHCGAKELVLSSRLNRLAIRCASKVLTFTQILPNVEGTLDQWKHHPIQFDPCSEIQGSFRQVAFSGDHKSSVVVTTDLKSIRSWDSNTGQPRIVYPESKNVLGLSYCGFGDRRFLLGIDADGNAKKWLSY